MQNPELINGALATNLARLRRKRGLSFEQLSKMSGVSKGTVVQIEQGTANPNINTLVRIANVFSIPVSNLIDAPESSGVQRVNLSEATDLWNGEPGSSAKLLFGLEEENQVEFWRWTLGPGHEHATEAHPRSSREMAFVLSGTLTIKASGETHTLNENEGLRLGADIPHRYENDTDTAAEFLMIIVEPPEKG